MSSDGLSEYQVLNENGLVSTSKITLKSFTAFKMLCIMQNIKFLTWSHKIVPHVMS